MKILITGNMGYIGPTVVRRLRESYPGVVLVGLDMGYFGHCLTSVELLPECRVDLQYFGDVRRPLSPEILAGVDTVVHLAAISNDPMGKSFETVTEEVNYRASVQVARQAKEAGARTFVFASSCSVYGAADDGPRTEESPVHPLTAYARSKVAAEQDLARLADRHFAVTSLRFATACGMSDRLRLDLVLNDFVAGAVASNTITILSDGKPWRPLIHVTDMARAIDWAIGRSQDTGSFVAVNAGCDEWNYQVRELADAVAEVVGNVRVSIASNAQPDKRSYKVSFRKFRQLAPDHQPRVTLQAAIAELIRGLAAMGFQDPEFRTSRLIRLEVLKALHARGFLTDSLEWTRRPSLGTGECVSAAEKAPVAVG